MAKPRAILKRRKAVSNIAKITRTMQLIATAKFKRAMDRAVAARPYTDRLTRLIADLSAAAGDFQHPLLDAREPKRVAVLAIASNRGLCGGYNSNVTRQVMNLRRELAKRELPYEMHVSGKKLAAQLVFQGATVDQRYLQFEDRPTFAQVDEVAAPLIQRWTVQCSGPGLLSAGWAEPAAIVVHGGFPSLAPTGLKSHAVPFQWFVSPHAPAPTPPRNSVNSEAWKRPSPAPARSAVRS